MQTFLLINNNPAVAKLVETSFRKLDINLIQISNFRDLMPQRYAGIIIDSQMYNKSYIDDLTALSILPSLIYIKNADESIPNEVKYSIEKPFLPTDFMIFLNDILKKNSHLNALNIKPKEDIFEILKETNEPQKMGSILKEEDIEEIQNIINDDIFDNKDEFDFEEVDNFKEYENDEMDDETDSFYDFTRFEEDEDIDLSHDFNSLEELNEDDIQRAFDDTSETLNLPQKASFEVVKDEIKHTIEHSISALAMQSEILRETLKGLKMNITITFEDR